MLISDVSPLKSQGNAVLLSEANVGAVGAVGAVCCSLQAASASAASNAAPRCRRGVIGGLLLRDATRQTTRSSVWDRSSHNVSSRKPQVLRQATADSSRHPARARHLDGRFPRPTPTQLATAPEKGFVPRIASQVAPPPALVSCQRTPHLRIGCDVGAQEP